MGLWHIKYEMEKARFEASVKKLIAVSKKSIPEILDDVSVMFIQSAGRATPTAKNKNREVKEILIPTKTGGERKLFLMSFFRIEKRSRRVFNSEAAAGRYKRITYWGLNRWGWLANLLRFGKTPSIANKSNLMKMTSKVSSVVKRPRAIEIQNTVEKIGAWAKYTEKEGLFKANIRLGHMLKKLGGEFQSKWG